ncbi:S-protein homolog 4-like [Lathyrus oleraceus]|uniref:S-protein homolog 4-like n=1 Tax=Pisum sativum TaxID=3888 RepID=UPI0021D3792A|nr:S-protein homolog 4-like [Pisum sativum]
MSPFNQKVVVMCMLMLLSVQYVPGVHLNVVNSTEKNLFRVHVNIVNSLEDNLDLTLHCKSKDDDLGAHLLHHGEGFSFNFRPAFIVAQTLFFCSFVWNGELHWFDIYIDGDNVRANCDYCNWNVFKSGPCRTPEPKSPTQTPICLPWNKSQRM